MSSSRICSRSVVRRGLLTTTALVTVASSGFNEAQAACYTGPYPFTNAGTVACIVVGGTSFTGNLNNTGTITPSGIAVTGSTITGSILSSGLIIGGISIDASSRINASAAAAISITGTTFLGGIANSGAISSQKTGISVNVSTFSGGIANSGTITSGSTGIRVFFTSSFSGGITNSGSITAGTEGISVNVSTFSGGIANSGSITAKTTGIRVSSFNFSGGITNSGSITSGSTGIYVPTYRFSGGIINSGAIISKYAGIYLPGRGFGATFAGGITNRGTINSQFAAIEVSVSTFSGGITNSGRISSASSYGIFAFISSNTFLGGITNTGSISGTNGIYLDPGNISVFSSGTVTGTAGTAIQFGAAGGNALTLGPGFAMIGNVLGAGSDTFQLGGTGTGMFDLSTIGPARQYRGFSTFNVVGATWVVSGIFGQAQPWNVLGGILAGTGTLSSVNINDGGTLAPGLPGVAGGTLGISGNLVMTSAATYLANVSPSTASRTNISGTATLAGTLDANGTGGAFSQGTKYTVLTATGGRNGTFGTLTITGSFGSMMPVVSYDANDVYLTLAPSSLTAKLPPGAPQNDVNVANAITAANVGTPPLAFQNLFQLPPQQLQNALTQLSGEVGTGAQTSAIQWTDQFLSMLFDPVGAAGGGGVARAPRWALLRSVRRFPPM